MLLRYMTSMASGGTFRAMLAALPWLWPAAAAASDVPMRRDATDRLTVPIYVNGRGPFPFLVDTGSETTIVSGRLAAALALRRGPPVTLQSLAGAERVETVFVETLRINGDEHADMRVAALDESHLGGIGMIGIDGLRDKQVMLDFTRNAMRIDTGTRRIDREEIDRGDDDDVIVVRARRKSGQLVLTDAIVAGVKVRAVIDTGAQATIANAALKARLLKRRSGPKPVPVELISVTGRSVRAELALVPVLRIGDGMIMRNVPIAFIDTPAFAQFGLEDMPALLLGMDILSRMKRVSIDFARRQVRFVLPEG